MDELTNVDTFIEFEYEGAIIALKQYVCGQLSINIWPGTWVPLNFKYGFKELKNKDKLALIKGFTSIDTHTLTHIFSFFENETDMSKLSKDFVY